MKKPMHIHRRVRKTPVGPPCSVCNGDPDSVFATPCSHCGGTGVEPGIPASAPGPKPEMLKISGDWRDAVKKSLEKKKPATGWPK